MTATVLVPFARRRNQPGFGEFDRIVNTLLHNTLGASATTGSDLTVRINVAETAEAYHLTAELPGIDEKEIELTVHDGVLTLKGQKHAETEQEGKTFHRIERTFGSFERILQLPEDADSGAVTAKMQNGVLAIDVRKARKTQVETTRIDITRA